MDKMFKEVAEELDMSEKDVKNIYTAYWTAIRETIKALPFKDDLSEEEFLTLKTSFNLPKIGKLGCTYKKYVSLKERYKNAKNKKD